MPDSGWVMVRVAYLTEFSISHASNGNIRKQVPLPAPRLNSGGCGVELFEAGLTIAGNRLFCCCLGLGWGQSIQMSCMFQQGCSRVDLRVHGELGSLPQLQNDVTVHPPGPKAATGTGLQKKTA